ncbi:MAG TPA: ABC transporter permease [Vicinamibacterales bacterium]|nr:ABC transporter permease [Vicinamibacterales bacterium]
MSRACYRVVARILPRDFRDAAGPGLEDAALACLAREREHLGVIGIVTGWVRIIADTIHTSHALWRARDEAEDERAFVALELEDLPNRQRGVEALMDGLRKDLRYTLRSLFRQPGFTLVTILTLALGIGANTAVFSVVNGVVLRPLGYPEAERLMFITSQFPSLGFDQFWVSPPEFIEYRDRNQSFESIGAYATSAVNLGSDPPSRPVSAQVSPELMPTLGVAPLMGRGFTAEDAIPSAPPVAILSWELWQRSFGGRADILEKDVEVNNRATRVVGVMPPGFDIHDQKVEIWGPLTIDTQTLQNQRGSHFLYLVGRLKKGVSLEQARADLEVRLAAWPEEVPNTHVPRRSKLRNNHPMRIDPLKDDVIGSVKTALVVLQAAVGFVLLIACANLANLLIARADSRSREYTLRTALGASRWRLMRQLVTEGLVLAVAAATVGIGLAVGGLRLLLSVNPNALPRTAEVGLDWRVLGFTLIMAIVTGFVFGLVPLMHIGRGLSQAMKDAGSRSATGGAARARLRSGLVIVEVALAVLLVVGAGLLIRSFYNLMKVDMGFDRTSLSTFSVVLPGAKYPTERRVAFYQQLSDKLRALPGVEGVTAANGLPPLRPVNANDTDFEHIPNLNGPPPPDYKLPPQNVDYWQFVTLGYTETMGIPVVDGRTFQLPDLAGAPVVLVNQALVARFFSDRNPIGARLKLGFDFGDTKLPWMTIIGVVKDVKQGGIDAPVGTELYALIEQGARIAGFAPGSMNMLVRAKTPFETLAPLFRRSVAELDPTLPLVRMRTMDEVVGDAVARPRFLTVLLGVFAGLALLLAAVGTYGILSYLVAERRQEIGIRMALGADRSTILKLIMTRGVILSVIGLLLGLGASLALTRALKTMLFNVEPFDPATLAGVSGVMVMVAAVACFVPAWRATKTDPLVVLKND